MNKRIHRSCNTLIAGAWILLALFALGCASVPAASIDDPRIQEQTKDFVVVKVDYTPQIVSTLCGLACLDAVFKAWNIKSDRGDILKQHPPKQIKKGYTLGELQGIAQTEGLKAYCVKTDDAFLTNQISAGRPIIIAIGDDDSSETKKVAQAERPFHSVVVCGVGKTGFLIMDPSCGFIVVEGKDLDRAWKETQNAALLIAR